MEIRTEETMAVMFADVCDSTRLYEVLGDAAALALTGECIRQIIETSGRYGGKVVKTMGDGALCTFASSDDAYCTAVHVQEAHARGQSEGPDRLPCRTGDRDG